DRAALAHRRSAIPRRDALRPVVAQSLGQRAPDPADLQPTIDAPLTPEIVAQAQAIGADAFRLATFVHDTIRFQPYLGSLKGAHGTLIDGAGNDVDQASLVVALCRAAGIPARYVVGQVEFPPDQLMNWLAVATPQAAHDTLARHGIPFSVLPDGAVLIDHVWVIAQVNNSWREFLAAVKEHEFLPAVDVATAVGFDPAAVQAAFLSPATVTDVSVAGVDDGAFLREMQRAGEVLVDLVGPDATHATLHGAQTIVPWTRRALRRLIRASAPAAEMAALPEERRHVARVELAGIVQDLPLPSLAGRTLTVTYAAATPQDQAAIDFWGGVFQVPFATVALKPQLRLDGAVLQEGEPQRLGRAQTIRTGFRGPLETTFSSTARTLTVGSDVGVVIVPQRTSPDMAYPQVDRLRNLAAMGPSTRAEGLAVAGVAYFLEVDAYGQVMGAQAGVNWTREPALAYVVRDLRVTSFFGLILSVTPVGASIDVHRFSLTLVSRHGSAAAERGVFEALGALSSATEHRMIERMFHAGGVSTVEVFRRANAAGLRFLTITQANQAATLPQLDTFPSIRTFVQGLVSQGIDVVVPERNVQVDAWAGIGFVARDAATGAMSFFIAGAVGTGGAVTLLAGGQNTMPATVLDDLAALGGLLSDYEFVEGCLVPLAVAAAALTSSYIIVSAGLAELAVSTLAGGLLLGVGVVAAVASVAAATILISNVGVCVSAPGV
ncbi:MAG TPA: transglutaminase-like domain-containing protein, partial [Candidatus Tectomicrobia bacterium]|nr:transglutaminase-like domain-containing protein [Candidatus Tectomicrobia bacterium]